MFERAIEKREQRLAESNERFTDIQKQIKELSKLRGEIEPWYEAIHPREVESLDKKLTDLRKELCKEAKRGLKMEKDLADGKRIQRAFNAFGKEMNAY